MLDLHKNIRNSVIKSQHCQRNWDLSKTVPETDIELMIHAATQCPSKQNVAFYNLTVIQDRSTIEQLHANTQGFRFLDTNEVVTNSQVLANLLFVFTATEQTQRSMNKNRSDEAADMSVVLRDANIALGIASGYLNLTATMLGYSTGCCQCFDPDAVRDILDTDERPLLMMGIGYKNPELNRRIHHADHDTVFTTFKKETIQVTRK